MFIDKYAKRFGVNWLLKRMGIYPNAYYNYRKHRKNAKSKTKASILKTIERLYRESGGKPGYRMMKSLLDNKGIHLSAHTVHNYMNKELGLKSVTRKQKRRYSTVPAPYELFENLLKQDFRADKRNSKWCVDFTYLTFGRNQRRYNCTIIDLYDRRVVASVNSSRINAQLAIDTLEEAIRRSGGETGMILHSDRGSQFTSQEFTEFCKRVGVTQSMSKPGCPYDNAPMERYFNTLKAELLKVHKYGTEKELYTAITTYAYGWYNNLRPHTYNGGLPPLKVA